MTALKLKIQRKIKADRSRLFHAWLKPEDFVRWFVSGESVELGQVTMDPRVNGSFRIDMHVDGRLIPHHGRFQVIDEPSKIIFTWRSPMTGDRETLVTILFEELAPEPASAETGAALTLLTLIHEQLSDDTELRNHTGGWTSIIEHLDLYMTGKLAT